MKIQSHTFYGHLYEGGHVKVGEINTKAVIPEGAEYLEIPGIEMIKHPKQDNTKEHYPEFDRIEVKVGEYL